MSRETIPSPEGWQSPNVDEADLALRALCYQSREAAEAALGSLSNEQIPKITMATHSYDPRLLIARPPADDNL